MPPVVRRRLDDGAVTPYGAKVLVWFKFGLWPDWLPVDRTVNIRKIDGKTVKINCAAIPREGSGLDEEEVSRFCKKNLATFKVPKRVFITDSVPKTVAGKIQRRIVAEHYLTRISTAKVLKF